MLYCTTLNIPNLEWPFLSLEDTASLESRSPLALTFSLPPLPPQLPERWGRGLVKAPHLGLGVPSKVSPHRVQWWVSVEDPHRGEHAFLNVLTASAQGFKCLRARKAAVRVGAGRPFTSLATQTLRLPRFPIQIRSGVRISFASVTEFFPQSHCSQANKIFSLLIAQNTGVLQK